MKEITTYEEAIELLVKTRPEYREDIINMLNLMARARAIGSPNYHEYSSALVSNFEKMIIAHGNMNSSEVRNLMLALNNYAGMIGLSTSEELLEIKIALLKMS